MAKLRPLSPEDIDAGSGEPRLHGQRLAGALGLGTTDEIRQLVDQHRAALAGLGAVPLIAAPAAGSDKARTCWLNKKQALYLCSKSGARMATEATLQVVDAFDAWGERRRSPAAGGRRHG